MQYFLTLLTQIFTLCGVGYLYLADEYLTAGWGLHPTIAGAVIMACAIMPYWYAAWMNSSADIRIDELISELEIIKTTTDWERLHPIK